MPDGTADIVLTFRNVHNWRMGYQARATPTMRPRRFRQMFAMLKQGGALGIEDHRLPEAASAETAKRPAAISRCRPSAASPSRPASGWSPRPRSTPIRAGQRRLARTACGPCRPPIALKDVDRAKYAGDRRERPDDAEVQEALSFAALLKYSTGH